jgi:hypothetical protein
MEAPAVIEGEFGNNTNPHSTGFQASEFFLKQNGKNR